MKIVGIDPGTAKLGIGILEYKPKKKPIFIHSEVLITSSELAQHKRLKFLYKELSKFCAEHKPDVMVIERIFFSANVKTAIHVGQARGVCLLVAADKKMDVFEYTALEAKVVVTGYGRADKKQMQIAIKDFFGLDTIIKSDDANDGVAMALCYVTKELLAKKAAGFVEA